MVYIDSNTFFNQLKLFEEKQVSCEGKQKKM